MPWPKSQLTSDAAQTVPCIPQPDYIWQSFLVNGWSINPLDNVLKRFPFFGCSKADFLMKDADAGGTADMERSGGFSVLPDSHIPFLPFDSQISQVGLADSHQSEIGICHGKTIRGMSIVLIPRAKTSRSFTIKESSKPTSLERSGVKLSHALL